MKIVVYEDDDMDTISRYSIFKKSNHQVVIYLDEINEDSFLNNLMKDNLSNIFGHNDVHVLKLEDHFKNKDIPFSDFYFIDGLYGDCFHYLKQLPKDRTYLVSGDDELMSKAINLGYKTCDSSKLYDFSLK